MIATPSIVSSRSIATQRPRVLRHRSVDHWLLGAVLFLLGFGVVMVYDASFFLGQQRFGSPWALVQRHLLFLAIALALGWQAMQVETRTLEKWAYAIALGAFVMVLLTLVPHVGQVRNGARRWLPLGIVAFEPSELLKPAFALYLARSLHRKHDRIDDFLFGILPHLLVLGVAAGALLLQPDFGATVVLVALTFGMLFAAGARPLHLCLVAAPVIPAMGALVWFKPYRWARLVAFLDPWGDPQNGGFQLVQSLLSFGSGGVLGTGLGNGKQKMFYLPEGHTDFIFALIGEELGLVGGLVVLACFAVIALRGFRVATRSSDDFSRLLAFGLTFLLVVEAAFNVAVVVGLLPTKGLPLPLVSYGGSSMIASIVTVAVLLGLSRDAR
ncbi:MAG: putative lipid II flippase FtsW [Alphaproteobacteria bacterium]